MKTMNRNLLIIASEAGLFLIILLVIWLDEFMDLPYLLFNAPPTPYRLQEYLLESSLIIIVASIAITLTVFLMRRAARYERYLRVCAWCRKIWVDDRWVSFEEYLEKKHSLRSSHGICESCMAGMVKKRESGKLEDQSD
jgi:hypothetical protein